MILNCTPPYNQHIPNPALGYLKGFLESKGVHVKNVYWNLILTESISKFQRGLKEYARSQDLFSILPVLYLCKQLLANSHRGTPLDLLYSSIYSKEELADMVCTVKDDIDQYINQYNLHEKINGFTLKSYQWLMGFYIIRRLKEMNPDCTTVVGGVTSKEQGRAFMKVFPFVDFAVYGEGEYPLLHLVKALEEDTIEKVPNLVFRDGDKIRLTRMRQEHEDLDSYPFADHSDYIQAFNTFMSGAVLSEYVQIFGRYASDQFPIIIPIWGSRSCPWNKCKFCVLNEEYHYRVRSPQNIVKEIEAQSEQYHVNSFIFVDTELPGNVRRFKTLLKLIMKSSAEKEKKYRFFAEVSPIFINDETAKYMRLASFSEIQIGFEGMTDSLLKKMRKRHGFAHNIQALKLGNRYGLDIRGLNVIRSIPTETEEDIIESCSNLKFLRFYLNTYALNPSSLRLDKGAPFYEEMPKEERKKWKNNPIWTEINPIHIVPEADRFEFFGFSFPMQHRLWTDFGSLLKCYLYQNHTYEWVEYESGSFVEEKGLRIYKYVLDRDETDLLLFCDTIKTLSEVKKKFSHVDEEKLNEMLGSLKEVGLLYCGEDFKEIISILDADERKVLVY